MTAGGLAGGIGTPIAPITAAIGAAIGFIGGVAQRIFSTYKANQQEEVKNAWKGFTQLKTDAQRIVPLVRSGGMSSEQAMVNLQYVKARTAYYKGALKQKEIDGGFVADISDYDGKMTAMMEWENMGLRFIEVEIMKSVGNPAYIPAEIYTPSVEDQEVLAE